MKVMTLKTLAVLDVARLSSTYGRAVRALPEDISEIGVPNDVEPEEDLGAIEEENAVDDYGLAKGLGGLTFDVQVGSTTEDSDEESVEGEEDEGAEATLEYSAKRGRNGRSAKSSSSS